MNRNHVSLALALTAVGLAAIGSCSKSATPPSSPAAGKITLYCAAGISPAMDDIVPLFTRQTGIQVQTDYGGSGDLLARIKLAGKGDIYLPAEADYIAMARKDGLIESDKTIAYVWPVIMVAKGNPKGVRTLADLAKPGLRVGLGNPQACQIGRSAEKLFAKNKLDAAAIKANEVYQAPTVNELGLQVKLGHVDAAIVWDAIAALYPNEAEAVQIPPEQNDVSHFIVAMLRSTADRAAAQKLMDFLGSDEARAILKKKGFSITPPPATQGERR
ncbi:MAG: molybdate ABC transporter substrate-binding protein [Phycisphaerae bacterium]